MKRVRVLVVAAAVAAGSLALAPVALAAPSPAETIDLSGTWKSSSVVIDSGAPYYSMTLTAQCKPANCYSGVIQFHYTDGKVGPKIPVGVAQDSNPTTFAVKMPGGSFINNTKIMKGHVNNDGSLTLTRCWVYLKQATKATASDFCDFPTIANQTT